MTTSSSRHPLRLSIAALFVLATMGCSNKPAMDIPQYPGSSQAGTTPNLEDETGTLYRLRRMTPDVARTVAAYYREELVVKNGWIEKSGIGPTFVDGNLTVTWQGSGPGVATPIDPTRRGGQVVIFEDSNRTFIAIWQHVPK